MALMTDSRTATLTQWVASSSRPAIADSRSLSDLHEIEQLERTRQLEPDQVAVGSHARGVSNI